MKKPQVISIFGKRWFERVNGNTYHTVEISIDGKFVHKVSRAYGYGDMYEQSALGWLSKAGYLPEIKRFEWGSTEGLYAYCQRKNIIYIKHVADVHRKKDL